MRRAGRLSFVLATLSLVTSCGEERELREWRADDHAQPAQPDATRQEAGEAPSGESIALAAAALFRTSCAGCHGVDGRGGGPDAPPGAAMPDLSAADYHEGRTDAEMAEAIATGRGLMPGFGSQLNARGIAALVGHVRTLRGSAPEEVSP